MWTTGSVPLISSTARGDNLRPPASQAASAGGRIKLSTGVVTFIPSRSAGLKHQYALTRQDVHRIHRTYDDDYLST